MKRVLLIANLAIFLIALACAPVLSAYSQAEEEKLGREYAKDVEQESKFVDDSAINERVNRIGQALAKIANEDEVKASYGSSTISKFNYTFKVVDDKEVNAFSLPGGHIYVCLL